MAADGYLIWQERADELHISQGELKEFHRRHFSANTVANFAIDFLSLPPNGIELCGGFSAEWEEADNLGFYSDGAKRTLTDEQIEIFRHSELRELKKQQEKSKTLKSSTDVETEGANGNQQLNATGQDMRRHHIRGAIKKNKRGRKSIAHEPKPDLRKRTWDVVDAGLDYLNYD